MPLKDLVVKGCELEVDKGDKDTATLEVTSEPSHKVKFDGKEAYYEMKVKISNYSGQGIVGLGEGEGKINPSSETVKVEGRDAFLEGDESDDIPISGPNPVGVIITVMDKVYVKKAGQTKNKAR